MRVQFVERENGPERLACEAEIVFDDLQLMTPGIGLTDNPLQGMKLVGFSLWRGPDGKVYVTFPSRAFGVGNDRKYFDYLRSVDGTAAPAKGLKAYIVKAWRESQGRDATEQEQAREHEAGI